MDTTNHIIDHQPESQQPRGFNPLLDINFEQRRADIRDRWNGSVIGTKALEVVNLMELAHGFWARFIRPAPNTEPFAFTRSEQEQRNEQMQWDQYHRNPYYQWAADAAFCLYHGRFSAEQYHEPNSGIPFEDTARRFARLRPDARIDNKAINALFALIKLDDAYSLLTGDCGAGLLLIFERNKGEGLALLEKCKEQQRGEVLVEKARDETTEQIATQTSQQMGERGRLNLGNHCAEKYSIQQKMTWWNDLKTYLDKHDPENKLRKKRQAAKHVANAWLKENPGKQTPEETIRALTKGANWRNNAPKK